MNKFNHSTKLTLYLILYWIIFIALPFVIAYFTRYSTQYINLQGLITLYILFIAPFLFIVPYKLVEPKNSKEKVFFIIFGLVIPYIIIYLYISIGLINAFKKSNFPF